MIALDVAHVVFMGIGERLIEINMKKRSLSCQDCADEISILTQVSSRPEIILFCVDCYNLKYLKEAQNQVSHDEKKI
jgi:hypothetical protein